MRRHVYAWLVATIAAVFPTVATAGEQEDQQIADHINQRLIEAKDKGTLSDFSLDLYVEEHEVPRQLVQRHPWYCLFQIHHTLL